jgi:protein gp37
MPGVKLHRLLLPFLDKDYLAGLRIFLTSMSDPFDARLSLDENAIIWALMAADQAHIWQVFTKRHPVMRARLTDDRFEAKVLQALDRLAALASAPKRLSPKRVAALAAIESARSRPVVPLPNVILGVSAEDEKMYYRRTRVLREVPAIRRAVSFEPMLGAPGEMDLDSIDWVIAGGESGPDYRPMELSWLESLVEQTQASGVSTWVKQDAALRNEQRGRIPDSLWIQEHCDVPGFGGLVAASAGQVR